MAIERAEDIKKVLNELINRINEDRRRIRVIEQSIDRLESSISSLESNAITRMGELKIAIERLNSKVSENSNMLNLLETETSRVGRLIKKSATKAELKQIESFIDIVNPITSKFVTKDELERALEEKAKSKVKA